MVLNRWILDRLDGRWLQNIHQRNSLKKLISNMSIKNKILNLTNRIFTSISPKFKYNKKFLNIYCMNNL